MITSPLPLPVQNVIVRKALESVIIGDSVQFRPANGGELMLLKIDAIGVNKTDSTLPRMFVGYKNGNQILCPENHVMRVITRSIDNEEDWIDPKYVPENS